MQPIALWPVMFYDFQWSDHDHWVQDLTKLCYELEAKKHVSGIAPQAKRGLYESGFDFVQDDSPAVQAFATWVRQCFSQAITHANQAFWPTGLNLDVDIHESWCHITRDGGYHDLHAHPDSSWSAIYYLDIGDMKSGDKNGVNRFYNPNHCMYVDPGTAWMQNSTSTDFIAEPGMMVIFPSWVPHSALTYRGTQDRLVIALNCKVREV